MRTALAAEGRLTKIGRLARVFYHWKVRHSITLPYYPTEISLELTNRCNFKCAFCPQSNPNHFNKVPATAINPAGAAFILKKLREGGVATSIIHWTLDGEPFMNKSFHEIVAVAVDQGFNTHHFATNGFFVTPERLRQFPRRGQRFFLTPDFCADEAYFERHRGTPGSWKIVLENLRRCLEAPDLGHFQFKVTDMSSYAIHDPEELDRRFEALKALFPASDRILFTRRAYHNAAGYLPNTKRGVGEQPRKGRLCPYPWFSFMIASNGDVVACCRDLDHKTVLGNLFRQEFDEIWNGEKYQALRRDLIAGRPEDQAACAGCDLPYDESKFAVPNLVKTAVHRMLLFEKARSVPGST